MSTCLSKLLHGHFLRWKVMVLRWQGLFVNFRRQSKQQPPLRLVPQFPFLPFSLSNTFESKQRVTNLSLKALSNATYSHSLSAGSMFSNFFNNKGTRNMERNSENSPKLTRGIRKIWWKVSLLQKVTVGYKKFKSNNCSTHANNTFIGLCIHFPPRGCSSKIKCPNCTKNNGALFFLSKIWFGFWKDFFLQKSRLWIKLW